MCDELENTVRAQKTPSDFEFSGVDRCKRCRKQFHRRISCQKQMKYFKTAATMGLKFLFETFWGGMSEVTPMMLR